MHSGMFRGYVIEESLAPEYSCVLKSQEVFDGEFDILRSR